MSILVHHRKGRQMMLENDNQSRESFDNHPNESLITITLDKIVPDEFQPRKDFSNLEEMIVSIKTSAYKIS